MLAESCCLRESAFSNRSQTISGQKTSSPPHSGSNTLSSTVCTGEPEIQYHVDQYLNEIRLFSMDEDERQERVFLVKQNRKLRAKIREQAEVFREERSKLLTVHHSLKQSLQDEQERNGLAMEEFNQKITELEVEPRRAQADPRIPLAPLELESRNDLPS
jgi:hypothetical protein